MDRRSRVAEHGAVSRWQYDSIIRFAYGVQPFRLEGAPAWTREERFDIAAKLSTVRGEPVRDETD